MKKNKDLYHDSAMNLALKEFKEKKTKLDKQYNSILIKLKNAKDEKEKQSYQNELIRLFELYKKLADNLKIE